MYIMNATPLNAVLHHPQVNLLIHRILLTFPYRHASNVVKILSYSLQVITGGKSRHESR